MLLEIFFMQLICTISLLVYFKRSGLLEKITVPCFILMTFVFSIGFIVSYALFNLFDFGKFDELIIQIFPKDLSFIFTAHVIALFLALPLAVYVLKKENIFYYKNLLLVTTYLLSLDNILLIIYIFLVIIVNQALGIPM